MPREDAVVVHRFESERADLGNPGFELVALEGTGGRDHGDAIAGPQGAGLAHRLGEPRHLGGNRLMLVAAQCRPQRRPGQGTGPRRREKTLLHAAMARHGILDPLERQRPLLHRVDHGFKGGELRLLGAPHISTASQPAPIAATVASGTP